MRLDCIVMAGGKATRMGGAVKPLLELCSKPMILWVIRALQNICKHITVIYTRATYEVGDLCRGPLGSTTCIEGVGEYVEDLKLALNLTTTPTLVTSSDIPFLDMFILEDFIAKALLIPEPVVNLVDEVRGPVGITLFKERRGPWADVIVRGGFKLLDVDTWSDYEEAVRICREYMGVK